MGTSAKANANDYIYKPELSLFFQTKLLINPKFVLIEDLCKILVALNVNFLSCKNYVSKLKKKKIIMALVK